MECQPRQDTDGRRRGAGRFGDLPRAVEGGQAGLLPPLRVEQEVGGVVAPGHGDANRQVPSGNHPDSAAAAPNAASMAATANPRGSAAGQTGSPPNSTVSAANATPSPGARAPESAHPPARSRIRDAQPLRSWPDPTHAAGHLPDHLTDRLGRVQPPGQHERREQRMTHPAAPAAQPRHEDLPAAPRCPDMTPVARPQHQRPRA